MTAAERFVKRMLGSISPSAFSNGGDNNTTANGSGNPLPEARDLAKHDERYHPEGYNPQTDYCSLRDGVTAKLTEQVDADILGDGREVAVGRIGKAYKEWSGGEEMPPWVATLGDEDLKRFSGLLDAVLSGDGGDEDLQKFEEEKNDEYVSGNGAETGTEQQSGSLSVENGEELYEKRPMGLHDVFSEALVKQGTEEVQAGIDKRQKEEAEKREAVARYLENGDEIELEIAGKKSIEPEEYDEFGMSRADIEKALSDLDARLTADQNAVTLKDINATMKAISNSDLYSKCGQEEFRQYKDKKYWERGVRYEIKDLVCPKEEWQNSHSFDKGKAAEWLERLQGLDIPASVIKMLQNVANGDAEERANYRRLVRRYEEADKELAKEREKAEARRRELIRMARREQEYQQRMAAQGVASSEKGAKELGIPEWIYSLLDNWYFPKQRAAKEAMAKAYNDGEEISISLDKINKSDGVMIFGNCPRWYAALVRMKGFLYRPKDAYRYSMTGDRTHTMRFQGFLDRLHISKGKVTLRLTPHCMVTDGWNDTTDSENHFISALRDSGIEATLGLNGEIEIGIDELGSPLRAKKLRFREFAKGDRLLSDEEVHSIVEGKRDIPEDANLFIDSVYRGGGSEYPDAARGMLADDLIPITPEFAKKKLRKFAVATSSVIMRFPAYSGVMGGIFAGVGEFEDGYVNGEVKCARWKDGGAISPCLVFSGARKPMLGLRFPSPEDVSDDKREANGEKRKHGWRSPPTVANYATNEAAYLDAVLIHELGHVYFDREANSSAFEAALLSTEKKRSDGSRYATTRESKLYESQFPWIRFVSNYAKTNMNELHSECLAMCSLPDYERGTLPKAIEDYCFAVLNGTL